jgi:hypothetical protein
MSIKWIVGLIMAFTILTLLANTFEYGDPLGSFYLQKISQMTQNGTQIITIVDTTGSQQTVWDILGNYISAIWHALTWDYSFLSNNFLGAMVKYIICIPITIGMLFGFANVLRNLVAGRTT